MERKSIGEVSSELNISVETTRLYEREGLLIPQYGSDGRRYFDTKDVAHIRLIRRLIKDEKLSIAGIRWLYSMIPCWEIHGCSHEERSMCPAYWESRRPCWAIKEQTSGSCLTDPCRECNVYRFADHFILHKHPMHLHACHATKGIAIREPGLSNELKSSKPENGDAK